MESQLSAANIIAMVFAVALVILIFVSLWKIFVKAGKPGWAAIVPIYNLIVLLQIIEKPLWWIILFFLPLISLFIGIITNVELGKKFGKSVGFGVGLSFLPFVFLPILAFGDAKYRGQSNTMEIEDHLVS